MKKAAFSFLFLLVFISTWGQTDEQIQDEILELFGTVQTLLDQDKSEESNSVLLEIDSLCLKVKNYQYLLYSNILRISNHHDLLQYKKMRSLLDQAASDVEKYQLTEDEGVNIALSYLEGCYYFDNGNNDIAETFYKPILDYKGDFSFRIDDVYHTLGSIQFRRGDYQQAINYYKKTISVDENHKNFTAVRASWEKNIANAYRNLQEYEQSYKHYLVSKNIIETYEVNKTSKKYYSDIYVNLGEYYHTVGKYDTAHYYLDLALEFEPEEDILIEYYQNKGVTLLKQKEFNKAQESLKIAEQKRIALHSDRHEKLAKTYLTIGNVYKQQNNYPLALEFYQKALIASTLDFNDRNPKNNPKSNIILSQLTMLQSLEAKASIFTSQENYNDALNTYAIAQSLIEEMLRKNIRASESRFFLVNKSKSLYESAIQTALKKGDQKAAFSFSQKSHGLLLWQNYQENQATQNSGIPDSLLKKEHNLKIEISETERQLYKAHQSNLKEEIKGFEGTIFELNLEYQTLLKSLEKDFPQYYQLKYVALDAPSISSIQSKLLDKETAMFEYFLGEKTIYLFVITKQKITVSQKDIPENFNSIVSDFRSSLSEPNSETFDAYCANATLLYKLLLEDAMTQTSNLKNIIVIPDEELNYIPFSSLIASIPTEVKNNARYDLLPFLVYDYNFSYNYSSALFPKQKHTIPEDNLLVGYAPSFLDPTDDQPSLDSLLHNVDEVLLINKLVGGQIYLDDNATLDQFKKDINKYKIAHLATHASCNDSIPADSKIHFHDSPLYANEIYNLPHQLSMAVLSACETGSGRIRKGEGIISMARAFISSGCPSVITSLWKVKDEQTSQIMTHFYLHLKNGKKKNVALNQAKRDYLIENTSSSYYHPYYWATFVPIGNIDSIVQTSNSYIYYGLLLLLLLLILLFIWLKNKK